MTLRNDVYWGMAQLSLFNTHRLGRASVQQQEIKAPAPQSTVLETLPAYHTFLKGGGYSLYTADDFAGDIKKLGVYLPTKEVAAITPLDVQGWISVLASPTGERLKAKTVSRKVAAVKNYFQWLKSGKVIQVDPTDRLITARISSPLPDILYAEECQRLRTAASHDPRAYLLILLLLETGMKKEELFTLHVNHFDFSDRYNPVVWIKHEGKKAVKNRKLQLPAAIVPVVAEYRTAYNIDDKLFPYTHRTIEYILKEMAARAGITKPVTAQILRDTCAVMLLQRGKPIDSVLKKLGLNPATWEDAKIKYLKLTAPAL